MNYYALLVALVLVTALLMHGNREKNLKYVIVACLLLFAIYGLRNTYEIGGDTRTSYLGNFWRARDMSWGDYLTNAGRHNRLFYVFTKLFCVYISTDYQLYISVIAAFVTICFGRLIYRYSPSPVESILYHFGLLYFTFHFSALKQSIAMAILMLAFDQIVEKRPIKFVLIVLVASQFHFPALVFLPMYWMTKARVGRAYLIVLSILLLLTFVFRNQIINIMVDAYKGQDSDIDLSDVQFLRTKALIMIVIVVAAIFFRTPTGEDRVYESLLEIMGIAIVFQTFCGYSNVFERLADYFFQFAVVFIPMVFDKNADRNALFNWRLLEVADLVAPILFCGYGIYRFLMVTTYSRNLYPFLFFFQK